MLTRIKNNRKDYVVKNNAKQLFKQHAEHCIITNLLN